MLFTITTPLAELVFFLKMFAGANYQIDDLTLRWVFHHIYVTEGSFSNWNPETATFMPEYIDVVCSSFGNTILKHLFCLFWPNAHTHTHPAMEECLKYPHPSRLLFLVITALCHFSITNKNLLGDAVFSHGKLEFDGVERCEHAV